MKQHNHDPNSLKFANLKNLIIIYTHLYVLSHMQICLTTCQEYILMPLSGKYLICFSTVSSSYFTFKIVFTNKSFFLHLLLFCLLSCNSYSETQHLPITWQYIYAALLPLLLLQQLCTCIVSCIGITQVDALLLSGLFVLYFKIENTVKQMLLFFNQMTTELGTSNTFGIYSVCFFFL